MTFDATPTPAAKGTTVKLTGRVWRTATGNRTRVDFFFNATGAPVNSYTYQGSTRTTDAGTFRHSLPARTTGTWKAVFNGTTSRRNAARLEEVQVYERRSKEIAGWSEETSSWQSPTIRIPTRDYQAIVAWTCADNDAPFVYLTWTGESGGFEYVRGAKPSGRLTLNGHAGAGKGFFKVSTSMECSWRVRVFSGITTLQV